MNKTAIKNFAIAARLALIDAVTQKAFEYEVTENGVNNAQQTTVNGRAMTSDEQTQRSELINRINQNGFAQTMEEAAYTWFNRFIALRFMEVNGYLPSRVRVFSDENNAFKPEILSEAMHLELNDNNGKSYIDHEYILNLLDKQQNDTLYKYLIIAQCNALNTGLPEMFEEIGGWTELLFPNNLLRNDSILAHMVEDIPEEDWRDQVQIIGWLYQYYNTEPKDKVFADLKKNIKISAAAIPAATQLFTPDWIVRYMVENSLGRLWTEGHGKPANADWKYYLEEAEQEDSVKAELEKLRVEYKNIQPEQIKVIDPCMGSGHILVYAFDVLMDIYTSCGWSERDAAVSILQNNLYGLDIDRRAYQLAYFAVMMKARQYNRSIIKNGEVQPQLANFADVMGVDTEMLSGKIKEFAEQFQYADTYGSLMEVTAPKGLDEAVSEFSVSFGMSRAQLEMMMKIYKYLSQKYDVVVTNPPYMGGSGMNETLAKYVQKRYPDSKSDLSTCFMEKCELLCKTIGFYSMINIPVWMFLSSYEKLREKILINNTYSSMVHFGRGVFGSDFGTTAFVLSKTRTSCYIGTYRRLFQKQGAVDSIEQKEEWFFEGMGYHTAKQENFSKIPGMPVAYWVSENVLNCFYTGIPFNNFACPKQGIKTADKERFLRFWHEISFVKTSICPIEKEKWFPCNKGGNFRKWYGNNEYVVNWENNGYEICNYKDENGRLKSRPQNLSFMLKEGLTYTNVSSSTFGVRYSPKGFIYDAAGSLIYVEKDKLSYALGLLASNLVLTFTSILSPTMSFEVGQIGAIPTIYKPNCEIDNLVKDNIELSKEDWDSFETSWDFEQHPLI